MRAFVPLSAFILFVFGLALTADRNQIEAAPDVVALPVDGECCGDVCDCCDACDCNKPEATEVEDLSSHIGQVVERKTRPGLWEVVDAWRDESGELMYMYRQVQSAASGNCPGGVCPQPMASGYYDGSSQWTYPGDIASHLQGSNHGVSASQLSGMSKDQMEALHDSLHNSTRSSGQAVTVQSSSCPGGVCPQPTTRSRGLFRWRR